MIGKTLSHYRILERLGEGAMGEVFLAEDSRLERPVALKILRPSGEDAAERRTRLLAEARAASALAHPNVAVVYEVDEAEIDGESLSFLALEYVVGEPLDRWVAQRKPSLDELLDVALQVADALVAAHARGFVHRDVKPSNLLVTEAGRVKIVDFGVAAACSPRVADVSTWTKAPTGALAAGGEIAGTLLYMAPEQALGRPIDGRADLYALGVVLYEVVTGQQPFRRPTWAATLDAVLHQTPAPIDGGGDPRLTALGRLVAALVAKERGHRPVSAEVVVEALRAIRLGDGELAADSRAEPPTENALAILPFANLTGRADDDWIGEGIRETVGAELARVAGITVIGRERLAEAARRSSGVANESDAARALRLARKVGARWVVSGAVQRAGEAVRATGLLFEVASGATLSALKEDGLLGELFALQDRLASAIASPLMLGAPGRTSSDETTVVAAYEALSRALINLRTETYEGLDRAILLLERAVALDPRYVRAWVELGAARATQSDYLGATELLDRALQALKSALALDPSHARARRELGAALVSAGREDEGIAEIERALASVPDDAAILAGMARALFIGRADFSGAARYYERAAALNPLAGWYWLQLAHCLTLSRELDRARDAAGRAIDLQERFLSGRQGAQIVGGYMRRGHVAALEGRHADAVRDFQQELAFLAQLDHALRGRIQVELNLRLGASQLALGERTRAAAHLDAAAAAFERRLAMGGDDPATRYYAAGVFALRGERERALDELAVAISRRPKLNVARARIEPELESLADEPRFRALLSL